MPYFVYMLECADGSYYTGITTDMTRRLREHNKSRRGAAYTRSRRPVRLIYSEEVKDRPKALKREYIIRNMTRSEKVTLALL
jgi:putative endonuclease